MIGERHTHEVPAIDEGSWVYLIATAGGRRAASQLHDRVVKVCEASGWPAVSWSPPEAASAADPGHFFEGVRHAVEHADVVVALLGDRAGTADAELALAYSHRRPIVGVRISSEEGSPASGVQAMLEGYERGCVITCEDADECVVELRAVFSDPGFAETIRMAAGEHIGYA